MLIKVRLKIKNEYKTRDIYTDVLFFISKKGSVLQSNYKC